MPKRHGNLFAQCFTLEALYAAYLTARRGKRKKSAVLRFEANLGANLQALHDEIHANTYEPLAYTTFTVREPKPRLIYAPNFRDVVVQHAIYAVIYPLFDATFVYDNYGCRKGKGTHKAADKAQQHMRQSAPDSFYLQLDIRKFFYRIDRDVLMALIAQKIKDPQLMALLHVFARYPDVTGIPIGNLLSQLYALLYLNPLDHFVKREMKVKQYVRYVDDFILFGFASRADAAIALATVERFLSDTLHLELSRWTIAPLTRGINFVGFRTWRKTRFVRKHSLHNFSRALKHGAVPSMVSILGNARRSATYKHFCRRLNTERPDLITYLPESHQHANI
jgi:retron-type reverse transcriptase